MSALPTNFCGGRIFLCYKASTLKSQSQGSVRLNSRRCVLAFISSLTLLLTNCGGSPSLHTSPNATITISPQITSLAINGTQTFTATVTGASPSLVFWTGPFTGGVENGPTVTYTAPATPPIYTGSGTTYTGSGTTTLGDWGYQGTVSITANVPTTTGYATATASFPIIGPTSVGMLPTTTSVQLGKLVYLYPYCVGWANNGINWMVNGVANGSAVTGTMTASPTFAYYTAPPTMPMTGNTVTVTA